MQNLKCPECEKLAKVHEESQKIGFFLEWLFYAKGVLCKWHDARKEWVDEKHDDYFWESQGYYPIRENIDQILADYFEIDMNKIDAERNALLNSIRDNE
jgi:hypothetical protein